MRLEKYPAFLNLQDKHVLIVGGGRVAERKSLSLLKSGANITVISPQITKRLEREVKKGKIRHIPRVYKNGDIKNAFLTIAATDSMEINKKVSQDASFLINVVDSPSLCNFIVPSIVRRGHLTIAISTNGISPALSKTIRKEIQKLYPAEFSKYLTLLDKIRKKAMEKIKDRRKRTRLLKSVAEEDIVKALRTKGMKEVENRLFQSMKKFELFS